MLLTSVLPDSQRLGISHPSIDNVFVKFWQDDCKSEGIRHHQEGLSDVVLQSLYTSTELFGAASFVDRIALNLYSQIASRGLHGWTNWLA